MYPAVFTALIVGLLCSTFFESCVIFYLIQVSANSMHAAMTKAVLRAKIVFFDSNPIGRIITRFSKDMNVLDLVMP